MYLLVKFGSHRSYGNGDMNSFISSYMNTLEKAELTSSDRHFERFPNQDYQFTIPKSQTRLVKKQEEEEEEEERRQLQRIMRFTQIQ